MKHTELLIMRAMKPGMTLTTGEIRNLVGGITIDMAHRALVSLVRSGALVYDDKARRFTRAKDWAPVPPTEAGPRPVQAPEVPTPKVKPRMTPIAEQRPAKKPMTEQVGIVLGGVAATVVAAMMLVGSALLAGSGEPPSSPEVTALQQEYDGLVGTGDDNEDDTLYLDSTFDEEQTAEDYERLIEEWEREARRLKKMAAKGRRQADREALAKCIKGKQDNYSARRVKTCGEGVIYVCPTQEERDEDHVLSRGESVVVVCEDGSFIGIIEYTDDDHPRYLRRIRQAGYWVGVAAPRATADIVRSVTPKTYYTPPSSGGSSSSGGTGNCHYKWFSYPC